MPDASCAAPLSRPETSSAAPLTLPERSCTTSETLPLTSSTVSDTEAAWVAAAAAASLAALRPRQASDGLPSVSAAAMSRPPSRPTFLKKWICCICLASGSVSSQKRCPASVVGIRDAASAVEASRGNLPRASIVPATTLTPPSILTRVSSSSQSVVVRGTSTGAASAALSIVGAAASVAFSSTGVTASRTGFAAWTWPCGDFRAAIPPWMKMAASIGRATRRRSMSCGSRSAVVANARDRHHARVSTDAQLAIGLDIGGTKIAGGVVDRSGRVHAELQAPTPPRSGAIVIAAILLDLVSRLRAGRDIAAIGVGAAGIVRWPEGRMLWAPNNAYRDWAIRDELERETGLPAVVDNDANVAGFAEARLGATPYRQMLFITVGTGIGGGPGPGRRDLPRSHGHGRRARTHDRGPARAPVRLRNHGCLEAVASGSALSRMGREAAAANPDGLIARIGRAEGVVTGHTVTSAAQQDDLTALDIFTRLGRWLGIGIASLATIFELEAVVIGGGVIRTGDLLLSPARAAAREYAYAAAGPRRASGAPGDVRRRGRHDRGRTARPGRMPTASPAASRTDH